MRLFRTVYTIVQQKGVQFKTKYAILSINLQKVPLQLFGNVLE